MKKFIIIKTLEELKKDFPDKFLKKNLKSSHVSAIIIDIKPYFVKEMIKYCGQKVEFPNYYKAGDYYYKGYRWSDWMIKKEFIDDNGQYIMEF